ncbi:hypothetical protein BsWGS_15795 [Bradybaena similaris]
MELLSELLQLQLLALCVFAVSYISSHEIIEHKIEPVFVTGQSSAEMSCSIFLSNGSQLRHYNTTWLKGATPVSKLQDSRFTVSANRSLIIDKPDYADLGMYIARFHIGPRFAEQYSCRVRFLGEPVVEDLGRPYNRAVGQNLELTCIVKGYPVIITWYKDDSEIRFPQNDSRVLLKPVDGQRNARLQVMDVTLTDSGIYRCEAWSEFFNKTASDSLKIRVTERYAAVWPFLGLFAEVTLLCLVIFLYERYHNRQAHTRALNQNINITVPHKKRNP